MMIDECDEAASVALWQAVDCLLADPSLIMPTTVYDTPARNRCL